MCWEKKNDIKLDKNWIVDFQLSFSQKCSLPLLILSWRYITGRKSCASFWESSQIGCNYTMPQTGHDLQPRSLA